jgi:hypothetical protein
VPYPCFFFLFLVPVMPTFWTYLFFAYSSLCIEYNHLDMCGMICTQHPTFSTFSLPLATIGKTLSLKSTLSLSNLQLVGNRNVHCH